MRILPDKTQSITTANSLKLDFPADCDRECHRTLYKDSFGLGPFTTMIVHSEYCKHNHKNKP